MVFLARRSPSKGCHVGYQEVHIDACSRLRKRVQGFLATHWLGALRALRHIQEAIAQPSRQEMNLYISVFGISLCDGHARIHYSAVRANRERDDHARFSKHT